MFALLVKPTSFRYHCIFVYSQGHWEKIISKFKLEEQRFDINQKLISLVSLPNGRIRDPACESMCPHQLSSACSTLSFHGVLYASTFSKTHSINIYHGTPISCSIMSDVFLTSSQEHSLQDSFLCPESDGRKPDSWRVFQEPPDVD